MFLSTLEHIFTKQNLKDSFLEISSKSTGIDEISYNEFKTNLSNNIKEIILAIQKGSYIPEPLKKIEINNAIVIKIT